jgi:hypothetical protein
MSVVSGRGRAIVLGLVALSLVVIGVATFSLAHSVLFATAHGSLTGHIVDDATGAQVAARVSVTDANGKPLDLAGTHERVRQFGKHWYYVDGTFTVAMPDGGATVEIRRGLETRPLVQSVAAGTPVTRTFRLRRWTDMRAKGYVSGDLHAHLPALAVAALEMRAEDLNALNLLILGGLPEPNDGAFTGHPDDTSSADRQIFLSQEVVDWHLGHLTLAGPTSLVPGYPVGCGTLEYWTSNPHCDVYRAARAVREQGGLVSLAHFENLPGAQTPVAVALGLLDSLEIPTWSDPMQLPAHLSPWLESGMPTAEFTPMRGADLYYQYLNAGFRLPMAAGTDKSGEDIPIGGNRVYVRTNGSSDFAAWLAGIKSGAGFVTNGPIIDLDVDGHGPGETVAFRGAKTVRLHATARSIVPFTTIEIVMNGRLVAHTLRLVQTNPPADGVYTLETEATVRLDRSSWLAARAFADPDIAPRLMPRESSAFSHTSPVYFLLDGRQVREDASIVYLRRAVQGLLNWLATRPTFASEADRAAVQRDAEKALRLYEAM